jgi:hypothetical protein
MEWSVRRRLQGTNAVIVHPNALGEREMAARTMEAPHLR